MGKRGKPSSNVTPGTIPPESSFSLFSGRKSEYKLHRIVACSQMGHPRGHNSHVLSAFCLLGKPGSGSQGVQRKAINTVFGKHRKPRWCTKIVKWYPRGSGIPSGIPMVSNGIQGDHHYPLHWRRLVNCGEMDIKEKVKLTILSFSYISDSVCLELSRLGFNTKVKPW